MTLPAVPAMLEWTEEIWGSALRCRPLAEVAPHLFTTRQLALTEVESQAAMARAVGAETLLMPSQVHGRDVVVLRQGEAVPTARPTADAVVSDAIDVAVAVRVADCTPILLADRATGAVGAVHAGWRGTAAGIVGATIAAMVTEFGTRSEDVLAAIGPTIGGCCYEVGTELVDAFAAAGHARHLIDRWFEAPPPPRGRLALAAERPPLHLNLLTANSDQLQLAGVPEDQIFVAGLCTAMHLDVLTSYRREGAASVRLAGVIRASLRS